MSIVGSMLRSIGHATGSSAPSAPEFSSLANGGDGESVVATVDGDSGVTNQLYYRIGTALAWTAGESRSGDGDVTQDGLSNDTSYSFLFVSALSGVYSLPSIERTMHLTTISTTFVTSWNPTSIVQDVRDYLVNQTIVTTENCFCKRLPDTPTNCMSVAVSEVDAGDESPVYPVRRFDIQILVRNTHIQTGSYLADKVHNAMSRQVNFLAGTKGICRAQHGPGQWYLSEANYPVHTLNYNYRIVQRG